MTKINSFIKNHPLPAFFILTFLISWGGVLILGAPHGMPTTSENFEKLYPIVFLPYLLGPLVSGLIMIGLVEGKTGYQQLFERLVTWRVKLKWYALALLTAPLLSLIILGALSLHSPDFLPALITADEKLPLLLTGVMIGLFGGGLMEEPGWTGFAVPRLRERASVLKTGLVVGFLWGIWHFLPTYWGSGDSSGKLSPALLLPPLFFYLAVLPAYRLLMVFVFDRTQSLLVVMFMHASLTASSLFIFAPAVQGARLLLYYFVLAVVLWLIAAAILIPEQT